MNTTGAFFYGANCGARFLRVKVPNPAGNGKDIGEGKWINREVKFEGGLVWEQTNHEQTSDLTNRKHI